nr:hypothetical protein [Tanacetum cinerariifolium]
MGDEHLSTILETELDEVIKSSVENLVPIPSESKGISEDTCDVPFCDNSPHFDVLTNHFELLSDFNDDCTSNDGDYFKDIDYIEASPLDSELISLEEVQDDILREKLFNINLLIAKIESLNDNSTPNSVLKSPSPFHIPIEDSDNFFEKFDTSLSYTNNSLPKFETFSDHMEETSSGSTTTHAYNSLLGPNGEALRKCILSGPYKPTTVLVQAVEATDDSPAIPEHTTVETPMNMSPKNKAHFLAEKEAIYLILIGIGDEIYSTVDACQIAQEMWEAIEGLQQCESLNIQDVKTNLFLEFGKFTSHDGEIMESYYTRFYKLMNELIRNNLTVTTMQVNVQFLQQLQPEWSREFGHFAKECRKPKRVKDSTYHKEKMLLCKQAEQGVPLQAEQYDWLAYTNEEVDEQELEAHYSYMAKIHEVPTADSGTDSEPVEQKANTTLAQELK